MLSCLRLEEKPDNMVTVLKRNHGDYKALIYQISSTSGMNEETWKEYCRQLEHRLTSPSVTMQSKIHVYESGRTEQEYDPDIPPELATAAGHVISTENRNFGKADVQSDLAKGSVHSRRKLVVNEQGDVQCPVVEMSTRSKLSCLSWNKYTKNHIANSDYEGIIIVWDVTTRKSVMEYEEHEKRAWSLDFSLTDPTMLVSGSNDCHMGRIGAVAFRKKLKNFFVCDSSDLTLKLWSLDGLSDDMNDAFILKTKAVTL